MDYRRVISALRTERSRIDRALAIIESLQKPSRRARRRKDLAMAASQKVLQFPAPHRSRSA